MDRGLAKCDEIQFDDHIKHLALEKGSITNAHKFNDPCKEERSWYTPALFELSSLFHVWNANNQFILYESAFFFWLVHYREFELVRESMHSAISMNKTEVLDTVLNDFSKVDYYRRLFYDNVAILLICFKMRYCCRVIIPFLMRSAKSCS